MAIALWSPDLHIVPMMMNQGNDPCDVDAAARQLEIFLDLVGYLSATTAAFFLDHAYVALTEDESDLRDRLVQLVEETMNAKPRTGRVRCPHVPENARLQIVTF